jgi:hypothetical protein
MMPDASFKAAGFAAQFADRTIDRPTAGGMLMKPDSGSIGMGDKR